jgi:DUF971 family protein
MKDTAMADALNDPDESVSRLENALERIARLTSEVRASGPDHAVKTSRAEVQLRDVAKELDILIERLRGGIPSSRSATSEW